MLKKAILTAMLFMLFAVGEAQPLMAEETTKPGEGTAAGMSSESGTISLSEVAPEIYYQFRRYPKFYGDENTVHGNLLDRSYLLDDLGGARDFMVDHGIFFDVSVTQYFQGNVSGGKRNGPVRFNGSADYFLSLDSGKAGLWSGGAVFLHAESGWLANKSVNGDTGALLPATFDATMPKPGDPVGIALPELYLVQALPANLLIILGKVNFAGLGDTNYFANNERTQFSYTGLVNNPILGAFIQYTPLGAALVWAPSKEHTVALLGVQAKGQGTTSGFDNFDGDFTVGGQYQFSPSIGGDLPGNYRLLVGYSNKELVSFDIDPRHAIAEIIGAEPVARKNGNYAVILNFDQYLWVKDSGTGPAMGRHHLPPVGLGIFGRAGWTPNDRNVIDQFYSVGIGGCGMLIPGRDYDQWGLGWAGTHISGDLRGALGPIGKGIDKFENAGEFFYNVQVTPAVHVTLDAQVIDPVVKATNPAFALGTRVQLDF